MRAKLGAALAVLAVAVLAPASSAPFVTRTPVAQAAAPAPIQHVAAAAAAQNSAAPSVVVPATVQAGDRLVMVLSLNAADRTVSPPTGVTSWTSEGNRAASTMRTYTWSKVAAAGDGGARVTVPLSASTKSTLHVAAYRGVADGPLTVASRAYTTSGTTRTTPVVTATSGSWAVSYWASKSESTTSWTPAASVTSRASAANGGSGRIASLLADSDGPVAAGDQGGVAATSNASSTKATTWTILLPAAGATGNQPPVAQFTASCSGLTCDFDASSSTDDGNDITAYRWAFGDGTSGNGAGTGHTYTSAGTYQVTLTVTDGAGATDDAVRTVTVSSGGGPGPAQVTPDAETTPVLSTVDSADDPAVWVHPSQPGQSLVIGNDKQGALEVYGMDGVRIQRITTATSFWGNVDVRQDVTIGGRTLDLVAAYNSGIRPFTVDPATRRLVAVGDGSGNIPTNGGEGLCAYESAATGQVHVYVITRAGRLRQYRLHDADGDGLVQGTLVREFEVGSEAEGCYADDVTGRLYVSQEDVGLWRYGAEPGDGATRILVDRVRPDGNLAFDVEGVTLADTGGGNGYLIVSAQNGASANDSYFAVYDRRSNDHLWSFSVETGTDGDGCERTDGIAAQTGDLGPGFRSGVFVCQDNGNTSPAAGNQNFKLVSLAKILPGG